MLDGRSADEWDSGVSDLTLCTKRECDRRTTLPSSVEKSRVMGEWGTLDRPHGALASIFIASIDEESPGCRAD